MGSICMGTRKDTGIHKHTEADMRMDSRGAQPFLDAASERSLAT